MDLIALFLNLLLQRPSLAAFSLHFPMTLALLRMHTVLLWFKEEGQRLVLGGIDGRRGRREDGGGRAGAAGA